MNYTALVRAVTLITSMGAKVITSSLSVVDKDGRRQTGARVDKVLSLLRRSPDGIHSAFSVLEDALADLLLQGNALLVTDVDRSDRPTRLKRAQPHNAYTVSTEYGLVYRLRYAAPSIDTDILTVPSQRVAHARIGTLGVARTPNSSVDDRSLFSIPPIKVLRMPVEIGLAGY